MSGYFGGAGIAGILSQAFGGLGQGLASGYEQKEIMAQKAAEAATDKKWREDQAKIQQQNANIAQMAASTQDAWRKDQAGLYQQQRDRENKAIYSRAIEEGLVPSTADVLIPSNVLDFEYPDATPERENLRKSLTESYQARLEREKTQAEDRRRLEGIKNIGKIGAVKARPQATSKGTTNKPFVMPEAKALMEQNRELEKQLGDIKKLATYDKDPARQEQFKNSVKELEGKINVNMGRINKMVVPSSSILEDAPAAKNQSEDVPGDF
jgi:hypothetical protein